MKRIRRQRISTPMAPPADEACSQAWRVGSLVTVGGQLPLDAITGDHVVGSLRAQVLQALGNVLAIVESAGGRLEDIVHYTLYVRDLEDMERIEQGCREFFSDHAPARTVVQAARLPLDAGVMVDAVAALDEDAE